MMKRTGFRLHTPGAGTSPFEDWLKHPAELAKIAARLRRMRVESVNAIALLPRYDGPRTMFYVDPPYLPETRDRGADYRHEMTAEQHRKLLAALRKLKGMVVLSGYRPELYDRLLAGWVRHEKEAYADGGRKRTECVWLNPACASQLPAQGMPTRADDFRASPRRAPAPAGAGARKRSQGRA
jgi:DNA adenine methylase